MKHILRPDASAAAFTLARRCRLDANCRTRQHTSQHAKSCAGRYDSVTLACGTPATGVTKHCCAGNARLCPPSFAHPICVTTTLPFAAQAMRVTAHQAYLRDHHPAFALVIQHLLHQAVLHDCLTRRASGCQHIGGVTHHQRDGLLACCGTGRTAPHT